MESPREGLEGLLDELMESGAYDEYRLLAGSSAEDQMILEEALTSVDGSFEGIVEEFYDHVLAFEEVRSFFPDKALLERVKVAQASTLGNLMSGSTEGSHLRSRLRVGLIHHRVGVPPWIYLGGYSFMVERLLRAVASPGLEGEALTHRLGAVVRAAMLDMAITLSAYRLARREDVSDASPPQSHGTSPRLVLSHDSVGSTAGRPRTIYPEPGGVAAMAFRLGLDEEHLARRKAIYGFDISTEEILRSLRKPLMQAIDMRSDSFYSALGSHSEPARLLDDPTVVRRLKSQQREYFERMTRGPHDHDYTLSRLRVGMRHHEVGLSPGWYVASYGLYLDLLIKELGECVEDRRALIDSICALVRSVLFDLALAIDAYLMADFDSLTALTQKAAEIVADLPSAILVMSRYRRVLSANRAFCEMVHVEREGLVGRSLDEALPFPSVGEQAIRALQSEEAQELLLVDPPWAGDPGGLYRVTMIPVSSALPENPGDMIVVEIQNATHLGELADTVRGARMRLDHIIDHVDAVVLEYQLPALGDPIEDAVPSFVSSGATELLGHDPAIWSDDPTFWRRVIHPVDLAEVIDARAEAVETGRGRPCEYRIMNHAKEFVWVVEQARLTHAPAHRTLVCALLPIQERRRLEERVEALERNRSAGAAMREVLDSMRSAIVGAERSVGGRGELAPRDEAFDTLLASSRRAVAKLEVILNGAESEAEGNPPSLRLATALERIRKTLSMLLRPKVRLALEIEHPEAESPITEADLERLVTRLALTLRDGSEGGETITLALRAADVGLVPCATGNVSLEDYHWIEIGMRGATLDDEEVLWRAEESGSPLAPRPASSTPGIATSIVSDAGGILLVRRGSNGVSAYQVGLRRTGRILH